MIRLVLFDIDGTLIHTGGAGEKAFGRVCESVFEVPDGTANLQFAGRTDTGIVRQFFDKHHIESSPENFTKFFKYYLEFLPEMLKQITGRVLAGTKQWLRDLEASPQTPTIGLLTGNIRHGAQTKLSHYGLWHHFATGGFGDDHENRNEVAKVARQRGVEHLGATLRDEEVLVIGDTPLDIECARAIGAKVLAVATGVYPASQLRELNPDWTVESLEEIAAEDICG
jgi:phosphoglycolate phosphatase-like HAD superfamily hydrolase